MLIMHYYISMSIYVYFRYSENLKLFILYINSFILPNLKLSVHYSLNYILDLQLKLDYMCYHITHFTIMLYLCLSSHMLLMHL